MSSLLRWRQAIHSDRTALQSFTCTAPSIPLPFVRGRKLHLKPWESKVQGMVRCLEPPYAWPTRCALVGWDDEGIAAVSFFEEMDVPGHAHLGVMAVATRCRNRDGVYANETVHETIDTLIDRATLAGEHEITVAAWVDLKNTSSQAMCRRAGMTPTDTIEGSMQYWNGTQVL